MGRIIAARQYGPSMYAEDPQPTPKMHNLYFVLYIYLIEIFISQYIDTPGTDVIAPPPHHIWNCFGLLLCFKAPGTFFAPPFPILLIMLPAAGL